MASTQSNTQTPKTDLNGGVPLNPSDLSSLLSALHLKSPSSSGTTPRHQKPRAAKSNAMAHIRSDPEALMLDQLANLQLSSKSPNAKSASDEYRVGKPKATRPRYSSQKKEARASRFIVAKREIESLIELGVTRDPGIWPKWMWKRALVARGGKEAAEAMDWEEVRERQRQEAADRTRARAPPPPMLMGSDRFAGKLLVEYTKTERRHIRRVERLRMRGGPFGKGEQRCIDRVDAMRRAAERVGGISLEE